jgi:hypothetical protein
MEQIAPRLKMAVPYIKPVRCEDKEELFQDGLCMAAHLLEANERNGKQVAPSSVAYYTILHLKSGRRSHSAARTDVCGSATQLDGKACVLSLETEVGYGPETMEPIRLGEFLSCSHDDPAMNAGRNIDWDEFIQSHDYRYGVILKDLAVEKTALAIAEECGETYFHIRLLKEKLEVELREFLGDDAIADSLRIPSWRAGLHAERERAACH